MLLTIRNTKVKDYVSMEDIDMVLYQLWLDKIDVEDIGFHITGHYNQLHAHAICGMGWLKSNRVGDFFLHKERITTRRDKVSAYIHFEDRKNEHKLENMLVENYYRYHYAFV